MKRREFLSYLAALGVTMTLGTMPAHGSPRCIGRKLPLGMLIIDAHAHPDQLYDLYGNIPDDETSTLEKINQLGVAVSSFAAVGDFRDGTVVPFNDVMEQLGSVIDLEGEGQVKIVRSVSDLSGRLCQSDFIPRAILSLEGAYDVGTTTGEVSSRLNLLYDSGVRMITLMHHTDNQFGGGMHTAGWSGPGLTDLGRQLVEGMISLGMVIDVAHAHYATVRNIAEIARYHGVPIIDSHTSLSPNEVPNGSRLRTWTEMELIISTKGLICTWPLKWERETGANDRWTIRNWAEENYRMKNRLKAKHIALGTDGGGVLPSLVDGYESILDIPKLKDAMLTAGFTNGQIKGYMGKNMMKTLKKCIG
jgi:membrane dipeptidase